MNSNFGLKIQAPGPRYMHPVLGMARFLKNPIPFLREMRKLGPVVSIANGTANIVAFGNSLLPGGYPGMANDNIKTILADNETWIRTGGLVSPPANTHAAVLQNHIMFLNGSNHKSRRRIAVSPISTAAAMTHFQDTMVRNAESAADKWLSEMLVDIKYATTRLTLQNNLECLMGIQDEDEAAGFAETTMKLSKVLLSPTVAGTQYLANKLYGGKPIPGTPYAKWMSIADDVYLRLHTMVQRKKLTLGNDLMSAYIRAVDKDTGRTLSNDEVIGELMGLYTAGFETTARTINWALFLLSQHPDVSNGIVEELRNVLRGRAARREDELPLLDAAIRESARVLPAVPISIPRSAAYDTELCGVFLPKGTNAFVSPLVEHWNEDWFPEPLKFKPERWIGTGSLNPSKLTWNYIPFGAGPRRCVGGVFADMQIRVTLSVLLQRLSLQTLRDQTVNYKTVQIVNGPENAMNMRVARISGNGNNGRNGWTRANPVGGNIHELVNLQKNRG